MPAIANTIVQFFILVRQNVPLSIPVDIDLFQERRTVLISAAVTGKINIRGFAATDARQDA